ncbi:L-rhamnonate dehydratase-like [Halichondria panicea]|uniref:L-rhamnonate dehydratase-like n=1 Tax=Halichondria panicea TaxID=6063 RepID=UPI00312B9C7F
MAECIDLPRIKEVRAYVKQAAAGDQGADCHDVSDQHWINGYPTPIANPMSMYPRYQGYRKSWGINALGSVVAEVEAEDGTCGVGVSIGGEPACYIIEHHLSRFVEGQDPSNIELMWDQMYRSTLNYGRKGLPIQAISAVDLALWDLQGKLLKKPVFALLGGKTKERLPVYSTTAEPKIAKDLGFVGAKIPCAYGPADGDEGLAKNVEIFRRARESVGPDYPLMLDCYMALSVPYAIKLARALEPLNLKWIEECLPPDDYHGYTDLKAALTGTTMVTTGEHEYTRYGFRQLIEGKCADIIQPDITWMGGITEARRMVAMAASHDLNVIPHGSSVYSYHLQYAFVNCPLAEYINLSPKADKIVPYFGDLFTDEPLPGNGFIDLPNRAGFGVTLNRDGLHRPYPRTEEQVKAQCDCNKVNYQSEHSKMPF